MLLISTFFIYIRDNLIEQLLPPPSQNQKKKKNLPSSSVSVWIFWPLLFHVPCRVSGCLGCVGCFSLRCLSCAVKLFQRRTTSLDISVYWMVSSCVWFQFLFPCFSLGLWGVSLRWAALDLYWQLILTRPCFLHHVACLIHTPSFWSLQQLFTLALPVVACFHNNYYCFYYYYVNRDITFRILYAGRKRVQKNMKDTEKK